LYDELREILEVNILSQATRSCLLSVDCLGVLTLAFLSWCWNEVADTHNSLFMEFKYRTTTSADIHPHTIYTLFPSFLKFVSRLFLVSLY